MFKSKNFCHIASNNRNQVKVGVFTYRTTDNLATVSASGYFNERIIDINLHDIIIHEEIDSTDNTKVKYNFLCVTERTLENVGTIVLRSDWQDDIEQAIEDLQTEVANNFVKKAGDTMTGALKNLVYDYHTPDIGSRGKPVMLSKYIASQNLNYKIYEYKYQNTMAFFFTTVGQNYSDDYTIFDAQNNTSDGVYVASQVFRDISRQKWIYTFLARPRSSGEVCLGLSTDKWSCVYTKKINNGGDLVVPAVSGTLATKADVDLAANSGRMITDQGVWYAKMYSATVAPSAENGTNYADFSQTDGQGNPIIVIYERQNGAWVQSETITPPAEYDGYVPITSKIWDIVEQAGQQGGRILWNHQSKEFTPYPQIISFEDAALTGTPTAPTPTNSSPNDQIANKEYVDNATANSGSGLNVGDIFLTMRNDNELNGAVECDGSTYNTTDFTGAQSIGNLLADGKVPYVSMAVYASTVASQGWCDKFGWDGTGNVQFKVPTLSAYIWQKLQTGVIGNGSKIGLQDASNNDRTLIGWNSGANYPFAGNANYTTGNLGGSADGVLKVNTDPTKSGMVAGSASDISQQRCMVQLATSATDEALETCTSVLADVAANTAAIAGADYVVESQLPTSANNYTWYRKYKSGWVEQGGYIAKGAAQANTVTFPIPFAAKDYIPTVTGDWTGNTAAACAVDWSTATTTQMVVTKDGTSMGAFWKAEGMAA